MTYDYFIFLVKLIDEQVFTNTEQKIWRKRQLMDKQHNEKNKIYMK